MNQINKVLALTDTTDPVLLLSTHMRLVEKSKTTMLIENIKRIFPPIEKIPLFSGEELV